MTLLSRVEALTGADRDVDAELLKAFDDEHNTITRFFDSITGWEEINGLGSKTYSHPAPLTGAVDAALAFAEKVLGVDSPTLCYSFDLNYHCYAHAEMAYVATLHLAVGDPAAMSSVTAQAHTLPIAILAAVLRAKEGM